MKNPEKETIARDEDLNCHLVLGSTQPAVLFKGPTGADEIKPPSSLISEVSGGVVVSVFETTDPPRCQ